MSQWDAQNAREEKEKALRAKAEYETAKKIELLHQQEQQQKAQAKAESMREYNQQLSEQIKTKGYSPNRSPEVDRKASLQVSDGPR